ncbi:uncharacterized protein LOC141599058 [Silene latifolia]|uniref:uncharacterized protein LOC141599058 n=1 Tax=Silene latifolia TaxID=37657 RepID=UPI003D77BA9A
MAKYEVSPDLINKLQIALRKESGISSFNPSDQLPPSSSPSILQDAIVAVGSNAQDAPRCDGCNGELLLGLDSTICVFCGRFPSNFHGGASPKPISFASAFGYQWFLRSLSLDGSESVERPIEGESDSGRGRNSATNEIPLSALLDLQLKWPDESNRLGVENEDGKPSTNLVGVSFDELFQREGNSESVANSLNEKEAASKKVEIKEGTTFAGQSSLSLFENTQTRSLEGENNESDWAVDFQSANADVKVDTGFRIDSTDWPLKQEDSANIAVFEAFSSSGTESKSEQPFDFKQSERNMPVNDGQKTLETNDASIDWFPAADIQRISDKGDPPHNDKLDGDDSTNWDEFGMFSGAENNRGEQVSATLTGSESGGGFNIDDSWNDFTGSVGPGHDQLENNLDMHKPVYGVGDEFALLGHGGMEQLDVHVESSLSKTSDQGESLGLSGTKEVGDSFDLLNGFKSSGIGDNSLDVWSDFTLSTGAVNSKPINNDSSTAAMSDFPSIMITHADLPQNGETKSAENHRENNDDFGSWSDFGSSWKQPDSSFPELNLTGSRQDESTNGKDVDNLLLVEDKSSHNSWSNIGWSTSVLEQPSHAVEIEPSESKSTYEDSDLFPGLNDKSTSVNNEEVDAWTDFTSSSNGLPSNSHSTNVQTNVIQEPTIHDPFGEWNVINSASDNESSRVTAVDNISPINMFSTTVDSHVGSNSFMHQDPFLGMLTDQNGSPEIASSQTELPNLIRTELQDIEAGDLNSISGQSGTAFKEGSDQKSPVVENLISEMHDLSFMLENSLSIPNPGT